MENRNTLVKALSGVLVGGMLLSGGIVYARDVKSPADSKPLAGQVTKNPADIAGHKHHFKAERQQLFQATIDQLVKDGVISQTKAGEIKTYTDKVEKQRQARREELKKLSPAQRKALIEKIKQEKQEKQEKQGTGSVGRRGMLGGLVKNNIISQEQADLIKAKMKENVKAIGY